MKRFPKQIFLPLSLVVAGLILSPLLGFAAPVNCPPGTLCNPLGVSSFCGLVKVLLDAALVIGIPIAVLFIVYAGFKFVMAQGNPEELR
jgi:hypothetical protein